MASTGNSLLSSTQTYDGMEIDHRAGDRAAKLWFLFAVLWFPFFATFGFLLAIKFFWPEFLGDVSWLTFGVIRPAHTNGVLFGFVSSGLLGAMLWITPRLCAAPLHRPRVAVLTPFLWNGALVAGVVWILLGGSQGREYAELPFVIDVAVLATLLILGYIIFGTVLARREKKLYVSLWYYMGTMLWFPIVYFIGNVMWNPPAGALSGVNDAIFNWYYGHNVLGLWFTTLGIPAWYYLVPKLINRPLYSHLLSLIAFFSIAFFYTGVGAHHLLQAPIPEWLKTVAVIMSILMIVPVVAFATNIMLTMRGSWQRMQKNPPLQFIVAGFFMYLLASVQGSFQALRVTNAFTHFSQWPVGHAHLALLGGFGLLAVGLIYWLLPRVLARRIHSARLMTLSFWTAFIGFMFFFLAMTVAGLVANSNWWVHINVVETLVTLRVHFIWRAMAGGVVVIAAFIFAYNALRSFSTGSEEVDEEVPAPAEARTEKLRPRRLARSQERISVPIVTVGGMAVFALMTFMVVAMPYMFGPNEPSEEAHPLATSESHGQDIYRANGCFYCHNQFVRPQDWAMGDLSESGDFYYSTPNFLGTERTGPSLGQIGGKRPTEWHIFHHQDPRQLTPQSIMPNFAFLSDNELRDLAVYVQQLGTYDLQPQAFQPSVPAEYRDATNPYMPLMQYIMSNYDAGQQSYSGDPTRGDEWTALFDEGKRFYSQKCISCHGGSADGQGPYARQTVARPANLHERLSHYPDPDAPFHFWRVSEGVPGTAMPPWGKSLDEETIWKMNTYEMSFNLGSLRVVPDKGPPTGYRLDQAPIAGTQAEYEMGQALYGMYCLQCHGETGVGDGPASIASDFGYIQPQPADITVSAGDIPNYGSYVELVSKGVKTTNMPIWEVALSEEEIQQVIFYIQSLGDASAYNQKWAPLYTDTFAKNLKGGE